MWRRIFTANAKQFDVVSLHAIFFFFMRLLDVCFYGFPASSLVYTFFSRVSFTGMSTKQSFFFNDDWRQMTKRRNFNQ